MLYIILWVVYSVSIICIFPPKIWVLVLCINCSCHLWNLAEDVSQIFIWKGYKFLILRNAKPNQHPDGEGKKTWSSFAVTAFCSKILTLYLILWNLWRISLSNNITTVLQALDSTKMGLMGKKTRKQLHSSASECVSYLAYCSLNESMF